MAGSIQASPAYSKLNCRQIENGLHSTYAMSRQRAITNYVIGACFSRAYGGQETVPCQETFRLAAVTTRHRGDLLRISKSWGSKEQSRVSLLSLVENLPMLVLIVGSGGKSSALGLLNVAAKSKRGAERDNHRVQ